MKDGYYLSAYLVVEPDSQINRVWRHDHNFALWKKEGKRVELLEYYELERYTGLKHHNADFASVDDAKAFINSLLADRGLSMNDINEIWGTPPLQPEAEIPAHLRYSYHALCHLYSSLLMDTELFKTQKILGFAVDGSPDYYIDRNMNGYYYYCGCYSDGFSVRLFPVSSPAVMWYTFSKLFGMEEGSLMALASASTARLNTGADPVVHVRAGLNDEQLIGYMYRAQNRIYDILNRKVPEKIMAYDERFSEVENSMSMTMKKVQEMSLNVMRETIQKAIKRYHIVPQETYLAMSGGFALNCPTNSALTREFGFKGFLGAPCPNDSGQSLGIGLYSFYKKMGDFQFRLEHAYYGREEKNALSVLNGQQFADYIELVTDDSPKQAVEDILREPVVWFQSRAEIGPRALGNRSLLGDPRASRTKVFLNEIKQRQWWRPVAPVILEDEVGEWFENAWPSPYMLNTFLLRGDKIDKVPAVAHMDSSARVQTVNRNQNPLLYDLLLEFKRRTGVPLLCNTSLNDRGEPMINTAAEAIHFALRKKVKIVHLNQKRVLLKNFDTYCGEAPYPRTYAGLFPKSVHEAEKDLIDL